MNSTPSQVNYATRRRGLLPRAALPGAIVFIIHALCLGQAENQGKGLGTNAR